MVHPTLPRLNYFSDQTPLQLEGPVLVSSDDHHEPTSRSISPNNIDTRDVLMLIVLMLAVPRPYRMLAGWSSSEQSFRESKAFGWLSSPSQWLSLRKLVDCVGVFCGMASFP